MIRFRKIFDKQGKIKKVVYPNGAKKFFIDGSEVDYETYCDKIKEKEMRRKIHNYPQYFPLNIGHGIFVSETNEQISIGQSIYISETGLLTARPSLHNNPIGICTQSTTGLSTNTTGRITIQINNNINPGIFTTTLPF